MNRKEIYLLAIITFLTVVAWIIFGIYHARKTSNVKELDIGKVAPLTATFDNDIINQLNNRGDY